MMNNPPRRGRRAGSPDTRAQILDVARRRFLAEGYQAVTMRSIAAEADVDLALISYFFGSKKGLFGAVLALATNPAERLALVLEGEVETLPDRILAEVLDVWGSPVAADPLRAMLGSAAQDPAVGTLVSEVLQREMVDRIAARIGGADARRRACDFAAHLAGLIMARYILRLEPLASLPPDEIARTHLPLLRLVLRPRPASPRPGR
ncbi:TetR family transcriptional regulator [Kitasatospora sp. NPDC090091]|uniref:TetR/AcrR family transcriptional regulator n=1 Tax=Kitasatospora sp. NPDC090091 TaxID=3364081 RepID=UPI0038105AEF